jgi:hypothetical protein
MQFQLKKLSHHELHRPTSLRVNESIDGTWLNFEK